MLAYGVALGIRLVVAAWVGSLYPDAVVELVLAQAIAEGRWVDAIELRFHPLYAALTALGVFLTHAPFESVARVLAIAGSSLVAPACAWAGASLAPERPRAAAFAAGLLAATHPYLARLGGQVMAYSLAHACLAGAVALALAAATPSRPRLRWAVLGGACLGLGYLARSDALATGLGLGLGLAFSLVARARSGGGRALVRAGGVVIAFGLAALVAMSPYLVAMRVHSGEWRLTLKKRVGRVLRVPPQVAPPPTPRPAPPGESLATRILREATDQGPQPELTLGPALRFALSKAAGATHPLYLALAAFGLLGPLLPVAALRRARAPPGWLIPVGAALSFVLVHGFMKANSGYTSRLHQSALGVLASPLAARGLLLVIACARERSRRWRRRALGGALALCLGVAVPKALKPQRAHMAPERAIGAWIRADAGPGELLVCGRDTRVVAYYADAHFIDVPRGSPAEAVAAARAAGARYLAIYLRRRDARPGQLEEALRELGLELAHPPFHSQRDELRYTWLVYRL